MVHQWDTRNIGQGERDNPIPPINNILAAHAFDEAARRELIARDLAIRGVVGHPPGAHLPMVYTFPTDTDTLQVQDLKPVEDINMLLEKYTRDVALLLGIPPHFVVSHTNLSSSHAASSQVKLLSLTHDLLFRFLQRGHLS